MNDLRNTDGGSSLPERLPPQNLEAERGVLASCLLDNRVIDEAVDVLCRPDDFYRAEHQEIWSAILELHDRGVRVDAITLPEHLERLGRFQAVGGMRYLGEMIESIPHAANGAYYAGIVREKSVARRLLEASTETIRDIYAHQRTASDLVCAAEERIFAVGENDIGQTWAARDLIDESMARLETRREGGAPGLNTGFDDVDAMTGGFQAGSLAILAARPSQGKTALALCFARRIAETEPVLFVSLEMSRHEIGDRMLSLESKVPGSLIRDARQLSDRHRGNLTQAAVDLQRIKFRLDDSAVRTVTQIAATGRRMKRREGLGLVIVDYLGLIDGRRQRGESRQEEVARISRGLKATAKHLGVPILALAQLNRQSEHREGKRPELADLRESGQIEADADLVLMLHRPEFYDPSDQPGIAELMVRKNRNGPVGTVRLLFHKDRAEFESMCQYGPVDDVAF